eukprot:scaffold9563_cov147-Skeletonema_dohrnii-CCMP3373.AAC.3
MNKCVKEHSTRIDSSLYAGYCVGCPIWKNDLLSEPLNECEVNRRPSSAAHDMPIRRVIRQSLEPFDELPMQMMELELYTSPTMSLSDSTDATDELIRTVKDNMEDDSHEDHSFVRQLIACLLLFGVTATASLLNNTEKRQKLNVRTPKEGLKIVIPTDIPPSLAPASPLSMDDSLPESEAEISKLREENQILQDKLAAMEQSFNQSITSSEKDALHNTINATHSIGSPNPSDSEGKEQSLDDFPGSSTMNAASTIQTLHNQIEDLKEELKLTKECLHNAIKHCSK